MKKRRKAPSWSPLRDVTVECSDEFLDGLARRERAELLSVWRSALYEVYAFRVPVPGWPGDEVTWLSIKRLNKDAIRDWRHLQWIKNDICGPEREAMEVFPAESRLVDTSNQFHLWVLSEDMRFPFGYDARAIVSATPDEDRYVPNRARQRPFEPGKEPGDAWTPAEAEAALVASRRLAPPQPRGAEGLKRVSVDELMGLVGAPPLSGGDELRAGDRATKAWSADGDRHPQGATATVLERVPASGPLLGYVVTWDGTCEECFVAANKLTRAAS